MAELLDSWAEAETILHLRKSDLWFRDLFGTIKNLEERIVSAEKHHCTSEIQNLLLLIFNSWRLVSAKSSVADFLLFTTAQKHAKSMFQAWRVITRRKVDAMQLRCVNKSSRLSRLIGILWRSGILYSEIPWGELDFVCCILRIWRWYARRSQILKFIFFDKLKNATDSESLESFLILRYARKVIETSFQIWRDSARLLKLGKLAFRVESAVKSNAFLAWFSILRKTAIAREIALQFSINMNARIWFTQWRLILVRSKLSIFAVSRFFKIWRGICLKRGTQFWLAARKWRLSSTSQVLENWKIHIIHRLKKKLVTRKVLNLAHRQLSLFHARQNFKAWHHCTQISIWRNSALLKRVLMSFKIYILRRQMKIKRKMIAVEMYKNETAREVMRIIRIKSENLRVEKLRAAVAREEERLRTLGRTLTIWRERVNVRKSFRI